MWILLTSCWVHINFWQRRQSSSSLHRCTYVNKWKQFAWVDNRKNALALWNYIYIGTHWVTVSLVLLELRSGSQEVQRAAVSSRQITGVETVAYSGIQLSTSRQGKKDVRPEIWNHSVIKMLKANIPVLWVLRLRLFTTLTLTVNFRPSSLLESSESSVSISLSYTSFDSFDK